MLITCVGRTADGKQKLEIELLRSEICSAVDMYLQSRGYVIWEDTELVNTKLERIAGLEISTKTIVVEPKGSI